VLSVLVSTAGALPDAFPLILYSDNLPSFLVSDKVYVASVPAKTVENPSPQQYIFSSSSDDNDFATYPDPRGNTLERGTEITLMLKPDAHEYLDKRTVLDLIEKHSAFSSVFPMYLYEQREEEVKEEPATETELPVTEEAAETSEDEVVIEEVEESQPTEAEKKTVLVDHWIHANSKPPLWTRY
jgi:heat shock protein beta